MHHTYVEYDMRLILLTLGLLAVAGSDAAAQTARYRWIAHNETEAGLIDTHSFVRQPSGVRGNHVVLATTWVVRSQPMSDGTQIERRRISFHCGAYNHRTTHLIQVTGNGELVSSGDIGFYAQTDRGYERGTAYGNAYAMACTDEAGDFEPPVDSLAPLNSMFGINAGSLLR